MSIIKRSSRFQFNVSTAIATMFVAGLFLWANVKPYEVVTDLRNRPCRGEGFLRIDEKYGWPMSYRIESTSLWVSATKWNSFTEFDKVGMIIDTLLALATLAATMNQLSLRFGKYRDNGPQTENQK